MPIVGAMDPARPRDTCLAVACVSGPSNANDAEILGCLHAQAVVLGQEPNPHAMTRRAAKGWRSRPD